MKLKIVSVVLFCGLTLGVGLLQAQTHYPAGVEGIKGPSLPPPGVYIRDYDYMYFANKLAVDQGPPDFDLFANIQAPRLIWITPAKIFGGYYGMDVIVPLVYQNLDMTGFSGSDFSLGDVFVEPITLSWHGKQYDASFGYGLWTPTGDFKATDPISPGKGFLTQMLTAGVTYYPDAKKTWSLAALNRYEFNQKNDETGITPGQYWTLEWGIGKSVTKTVEVGATGFFQAQTTKASGLDASAEKDHVAGIGPEINLACPKLKLSTSIRYVREVGAHNRTEGNVLNVIFTRRF
ncbi:MAG TPA: transporter [Acidobacteriota bacterium]|nr:transporter [Acidobacteriota bacterium]